MLLTFTPTWLLLGSLNSGFLKVSNSTAKNWLEVGSNALGIKQSFPPGMPRVWFWGRSTNANPAVLVPVMENVKKVVKEEELLLLPRS
ncbi:hypothetical protein M758_2G112900 [Ceratodon purpureus]|nr:hypothetical protein M758_2G112900 [Ceratodon purpureus]